MSRVEYQAELAEYADAFRTTRLAKNVFAWIVFAAILVQIAGFVLVHFVGVLDASAGEDPGRVALATRPTDADEADATPPEAPADTAEGVALWYNVLLWALPATKFFGLVAVILLALALMFAVKIALQGGFAGVAALVSAFFWSLILLAMLTPWQQVFNTTVVTGALYNYGELKLHASALRESWGGGASANTMDWIVYYARFLAYPVVALLVWLVIMVRFGGGCRRALQSTETAQAGGERPAAPESDA